jgi:hypothetical protein
MTYDHLLPIYLQDKRVNDISAFGITPSVFAGGLGLRTQDVGLIMSVDGLIALFIQALVFPLLADKCGVWNLTIFVTIGHPISYFIVPYLAALPENWVYATIYVCLAIRCFEDRSQSYCRLSLRHWYRDSVYSLGVVGQHARCHGWSASGSLFPESEEDLLDRSSGSCFVKRPGGHPQDTGHSCLRR